MGLCLAKYKHLVLLLAEQNIKDKCFFSWLAFPGGRLLGSRDSVLLEFCSGSKDLGREKLFHEEREKERESEKDRKGMGDRVRKREKEKGRLMERK